MAAAAAEDVKFEEEEEEEDISIRRRRRNHEHRENLEALFNADFDLLNSDFLGYLAKYLVRREFPILNFLLTNVLAAFITPPLTTCPEGKTRAGGECANSDPGPIDALELMLSAVGESVERARESKERHVPQEAAM
mmetsp:Transcript_54729/g.150837  ORF Transcript_54729/g.150837 Transcript_54729/m.150837 type:complete len:136 (-) Transcript_54729:31-438(-)